MSLMYLDSAVLVDRGRDPARTGAPIEIRLSSTVGVRFSPVVTASVGGRTLRAGVAVIVEDRAVVSLLVSVVGR